MAELADLLARVAALEAERDILRTLHAYGHTIGRGDDEGWLDCFTDEAVFEVHRRNMSPQGQATHPHPDVRAAGGAVVRYEGRSGQRQFISRHPRPPARWHKHMVIDPAVTLKGDRATAVSFFVRLDAGPTGEPHLTSFGRYLDELVRCPDGRWRFTLRAAEVESRGPDPF